MSPKTGAWRLPITILIQVLSIWPYYCQAEILPNSDYRPLVAKQLRPKETAQPPYTQYFSRHAYNHTFSERKYIYIILFYMVICYQTIIKSGYFSKSKKHLDFITLNIAIATLEYHTSQTHYFQRKIHKSH